MKAEHGNPELDLRIANSSITSYIAFDKREGLVAMGKRLFRGELAYWSRRGPLLIRMR